MYHFLGVKSNCLQHIMYPRGGGGVLTQKKPVATPKSANWHWFFLVFFGFFLVFLALVLARIRNWKLVFLVFFGFFWVFLGFFWLKLWPTFVIRNWFLGFIVFFGFFFGIFWFFLAFDF